QDARHQTGAGDDPPEVELQTRAVGQGGEYAGVDESNGGHHQEGGDARRYLAAEGDVVFRKIEVAGDGVVALCDPFALCAYCSRHVVSSSSPVGTRNAKRETRNVITIYRLSSP